MSKEEILLTEIAGFIHIKTNSHHPEFWDSGATYSDKGHIVDGSKMPSIAILEMCCDWCAMSAEMGNTPQEWFEKMKNVKWRFTNQQEIAIGQNLNRAWECENVEVR